MRRGLPALLFVVAAAAGCGNSFLRPGLLIIEPTKERFEVGDTIKINLRNTGQTLIAFQTCGNGSTLERQVAGKWEPILIGEGGRVTCPTPGRIPVVLAGQTRTDFVVRFSGAPEGVLPAQFPAGTYRVVLVSVMDESDWYVLPRESAPFHYAGVVPN